MPILLMFVNYVVTLFVGLAVLTGAAPWWLVGVLPAVIYLQYRLYRANEPDDHVPHARHAHT